jgi:uncharacterized protein (DUF433 family)
MRIGPLLNTVTLDGMRYPGYQRQAWTVRAIARLGSEEPARPCSPRELGAILELGDLVMASLDWSQCPAVESIPGKVSGAWVFRGTRMPVQTVFENLEAGMSVDDITEVFDVTPEEVRAVLHFASESLAKAPTFG